MGVRLSRLIAASPSWPGLSRPSTPYFAAVPEDVDGRDKPGHDGETVVRPLNLTPMPHAPLSREAGEGRGGGHPTPASVQRLAVHADRNHSHHHGK